MSLAPLTNADTRGWVECNDTNCGAMRDSNSRHQSVKRQHRQRSHQNAVEQAVDDQLNGVNADQGTRHERTREDEEVEAVDDPQRQ